MSHPLSTVGAMATVTTILVLLHVICWAAAFGIWVAAAKTRQPNPGMAHASAGAAVFGALAMVTAVMAGMQVDHMILGIKLLIAVLVAVAAFIAIKQRENTSSSLWFAIPVGLVINMILGVAFL